MLTYESLLVLVRALPEECLSSCVPPCAAVVSGIDANSTGVAHFLSCPELYCCEGKPSPDNPWPCDSISPCARNRTGPLCGHCVSGLTEVFGSPVCVPRRECSFSQVGCAQCLANVVVVVAATAVVVAVRHAHVLRVGVFVSSPSPFPPGAKCCLLTGCPCDHRWTAAPGSGGHHAVDQVRGTALDPLLSTQEVRGVHTGAVLCTGGWSACPCMRARVYMCPLFFSTPVALCCQL
jgi:hypothetical protein